MALTGWNDDKDRARSKKAGVDHHLIKPVNLEAVERLLTALEGQRKHQGPAGS